MGPQLVTCPFCNQQYTIAPEQAAAYVGQQVPCSNCKGVFQVIQNGETLQAVASVQPSGPMPMAYAQAPAPSTNGFAIAGLVCGIVGFFSCGVMSIAGLICSIVGLKKARRTGQSTGLSIAGITVSAISLLLLPLVLLGSFLGASRSTARVNRVMCAANLRTIGQASLLYSNDYKGMLAPDFDALLATQQIMAKNFVCPADKGPGTQQLGTKQCSFIWVGKGLRSSSNPRCVIAYEPLSNHTKGSNFLFADGSVQFISATRAVTMISDLQAGRNPPGSTTQPSNLTSDIEQ